MANSKIRRNWTFVDTDWVVLRNLGWQASGAGKYFAQVNNLIPSGQQIKSIIILDFGGLTESVNVQPALTYGLTSAITLLSNTNMFSEYAKLKFRIVY